ncbi:hypothetical protein B0H13DRAFT_2442622 [Mycena leptocephala]|nr:hypothetical protein B0H13DRAFT_2442622 [Mycena leptocephala]
MTSSEWCSQCTNAATRVALRCAVRQRGLEILSRNAEETRGDLVGLHRARGDVGGDGDGVIVGEDEGDVGVSEGGDQGEDSLGHAAGVVGEQARQGAVPAEDASKAVFELEPIVYPQLRVDRTHGSGVAPDTELAHLRPTTASTHTELPIEVGENKRKESPPPHGHARKGNSAVRPAGIPRAHQPRARASRARNNKSLADAIIPAQLWMQLDGWSESCPPDSRSCTAGTNSTEQASCKAAARCSRARSLVSTKLDKGQTVRIRQRESSTHVVARWARELVHRPIEDALSHGVTVGCRDATSDSEAAASYAGLRFPLTIAVRDSGFHPPIPLKASHLLDVEWSARAYATENRRPDRKLNSLGN